MFSSSRNHEKWGGGIRRHGRPPPRVVCRREEHFCGCCNFEGVFSIFMETMGSCSCTPFLVLFSWDYGSRVMLLRFTKKYPVGPHLFARPTTDAIERELRGWSPRRAACWATLGSVVAVILILALAELQTQTRELLACATTPFDISTCTGCRHRYYTEHSAPFPPIHRTISKLRARKHFSREGIFFTTFLVMTPSPDPLHNYASQSRPYSPSPPPLRSCSCLSSSW